MPRVVVVTGAAGGIGRATVELFHREGWYVVGIDRATRNDLPGADQYITADLADAETSSAVFNGLADLGSIDALINNAAIQIAKDIVHTQPEEWDMVMAANVRAAYLAIRAAHTLMRERGGAIVNVSSVHALATSPGLAAYAASKGALAALTRAAAVELAPDGIRVNAVLPGAVDTPMLRGSLSAKGDRSVDAGMRSLSSRTPLGRVGQPEEIAQTILFLADATRSSFVTGHALVVDGGATARLSTE